MNNFKSFLKEKKDLLIFMGVLILTFIGVISIAQLAKNPDDGIDAGGNINTQTPIDDNTPTLPQPKMTIQAPVKEEYVISREYFDVTSDVSVLVNALMVNGNSYIESKGISFKTVDNKIFDVYSVYAGEVVDVSGDTESLEGYKVTIKHENDLVSVYSALSSVIVTVGDKVDLTTKIGVSGTSVIDLEAGIHVHLELLESGEYINPKSAIGKEIDQLTSSVK